MSGEPLHVEDVLRENGFYMSTTAGKSMWPLLKHRRDEVIIRPVTGRLHKYDVPLYRFGGKLILHRIVKVTPDGYVICGDNCYQLETAVTDGNIIGVLSAFYRKGKYHTVEDRGYRVYSRVWVALYPLRWLVLHLRKPLATIYHRIQKRTCD